MANRRYLDYIIALNFTEASGRSKLYVGKDNFYITPAGFPIPHDAPYKPKFQKYIFAFAEVSSNISRELRVYSGGGDARDSSCTVSSNKNVNVRGDDEFVVIYLNIAIATTSNYRSSQYERTLVI